MAAVAPEQCRVSPLLVSRGYLARSPALAPARPRRHTRSVRMGACIAGCIGLLGAMPASALAAGEWLPAQKLTAADMTTPQLGVYANGETIAAWSPRYPGSDPPEVTVRPPGGAFGAPQAVPA